METNVRNIIWLGLILVSAGITDIMIVTGIEHCGAMISLLGSNCCDI